ncbi:T9SS type A sorting domain-containing protein [bacterium]|nr:T9SS type A sorting domain-containing protein [bacterium]
MNYKIITGLLSVIIRVQAGSIVSIPSSASIIIPDGGYFCADEINVASGGTFTASNPEDVCVTPTGAGDISLPVELAFFNARLEEAGTAITLDWETESETENLGFIVERLTHENNSFPVIPSGVEGRDDEQGSNDEWEEIASYLSHSELEGQGSKVGKTIYSYVDDSVEPGNVYDYRLGDVSYDGEIAYHIQAVVGISVPVPLPDEHVLYQNFPNPFNPATVIRYALAEAEHVSLKIVNIRGQNVLSLVNDQLEAGYYQTDWSGVDESGNLVGAGVYLCLFRAGKETRTIKMMYLR